MCAAAAVRCVIAGLRLQRASLLRRFVCIFKIAAVLLEIGAGHPHGVNVCGCQLGCRPLRCIPAIKELIVQFDTLVRPYRFISWHSKRDACSGAVEKQRAVQGHGYMAQQCRTAQTICVERMKCEK